MGKIKTDRQRNKQANCIEDQLRNLSGSMQIETARPVLKKIIRISKMATKGPNDGPF